MNATAPLNMLLKSPDIFEEVVKFTALLKATVFKNMAVDRVEAWHEGT